MSIRKFIHKTLLESLADYNITKTSVVAIFNQEHKLLILQRGSTAPWYPNAWSLVGGQVDGDESPLDAAKRETHEETGLNIYNISSIKSIHTKDAGELIYFVAYTDSDNVILSSENQNYEFISSKQLNDFNFVPYVKEFLQHILKNM